MANSPSRRRSTACGKTYGALLASAGVPIHSIRKLLGHSDVRVTAEIYADVLSDALREQVEGAFAKFTE